MITNEAVYQHTVEYKFGLGKFLGSLRKHNLEKFLPEKNFDHVLTFDYECVLEGNLGEELICAGQKSAQIAHFNSVGKIINSTQGRSERPAFH